MLSFIAGLFVGAGVGVIMLALCVAAGRRSEDEQ